MTLLAGFQALLARCSGREQIAVGTPVAQRPAGSERLIGLFLNTLVLRSEVRGSFADLVAAVRTTALAAFEHDSLPYEELAGGRSLFSVMFALQTTRPPELTLPGVLASASEVATGAVRFDLSLSLREREGALSGTLEYDSARFDRGRMERLMAHFSQV